MPRKPSYAALEQELRDVKRRESLQHWSLLLTLEGKPDAVLTKCIATDITGDYEYRLYGSALSFGGLIVRIFRHTTNDHDQMTTEYLDDAIVAANSSAQPWFMRDAINKLRTVRDRIVASTSLTARSESRIPRSPDTEAAGV
ncbi:MAG: hypothetical protein E6Q97_16980 [Desulfurellales bacterium]|nr:MAG: hypothetical protein E6Q97_16980 [Desulfurellales bacterium]